MKVYLIGALKNPQIPVIARQLREDGLTVFDDWFAAGVDADTIWRGYELQRQRRFADALRAPHAQAAFQTDKRLLDESDAAVLVLPAGRSGHLELGYAAGSKKKTAILLEGEPERFDVMYAFADAVVNTVAELRGWLHERSIDKPVLGGCKCGNPVYPSGGFVKTLFGQPACDVCVRKYEGAPIRRK